MFENAGQAVRQFFDWWDSLPVGHPMDLAVIGAVATVLVVLSVLSRRAQHARR